MLFVYMEYQLCLRCYLYFFHMMPQCFFVSFKWCKCPFQTSSKQVQIDVNLKTTHDTEKDWICILKLPTLAAMLSFVRVSPHLSMSPYDVSIWLLQALYDYYMSFVVSILGFITPLLEAGTEGCRSQRRCCKEIQPFPPLLILFL